METLTLWEGPALLTSPLVLQMSPWGAPSLAWPPTTRSGCCQSPSTGNPQGLEVRGGTAGVLQDIEPVPLLPATSPSQTCEVRSLDTCVCLQPPSLL